MQIEIKMNGEMHEMRSILKAIAMSQMVDRTESFELKAVERTPVGEPAVTETVENVTETDENVTGTTNTETFTEVVVDAKSTARSEAAKLAAKTRAKNKEAANASVVTEVIPEPDVLDDSVDDRDVTLADIKTFAMDLVQKSRKSIEVNAAIKGAGYSKISEIEPKDFTKVMQALREIR